MKNKPLLRTKWIALGLGIVLAGAAVGFTLGNNNLNTASATAESLASQLSMASASTDLESPFKAVYDEASQSIVGIQLSSQPAVLNGRIQNNSALVGSGVVVREGYVVTNYHVVANGGSEVASKISVIYNEETYDATYVAGDETADIAVLAVADLNAPPVTIGNSDELSVGDWALVIGNPLGESFTNTLSVGIISGLNRDMSDVSGSTTMIQTDAAINSGNSGGGLFNIRGELVGITSMKLSGRTSLGSAYIEGIGFAIPINEVANVADDLIDYGEIKYPRIGVSVNNVDSPSDEPTAEYLPRSVLVLDVEKDSPAANAGMKNYDLITAVNGERITTAEELQAAIRNTADGESVEVTVYRIEKLNALLLEEEIPEGEYITFTIEPTME